MGETVAGPRGVALVKFTCTGCPALATEDWEFHEENDGVDRGTTAKCTAADKVIDSYWHDGQTPPSWCPHHSTPSIQVDNAMSEHINIGVPPFDRVQHVQRG